MESDIKIDGGICWCCAVLTLHTHMVTHVYKYVRTSRVLTFDFYWIFVLTNTFQDSYLFSVTFFQLSEYIWYLSWYLIAFLIQPCILNKHINARTLYCTLLYVQVSKRQLLVVHWSDTTIPLECSTKRVCWNASYIIIVVNVIIITFIFIIIIIITIIKILVYSYLDY